MEESPIVRTGSDGEICVFYPKLSVYQFWHWAECGDFYKAEKYKKGEPEEDFEDSKEILIAGAKQGATYVGDSLSLRSIIRVPGRKCWDVAIMTVSEAKQVLLSLVRTRNGSVLEARCVDEAWTIKLPPYLTGELKIKATSQYVTVLNKLGLVYVLKYDTKAKVPLVSANTSGDLLSVVTHSSRPVAERAGIELAEGDLLFQTAISDNNAIYDIVGSWLVYSPLKVEIEYYKQLVHSSDQVSSSLQLLKLRKSLYTTVKLPAPGPLLYRVVSGVSNLALDKLYKLSEMSSKRVRGYLARSDKILDKDVSLNSISNSIGSALYSTANKIKKLAMSYGENEIIKVIDLTNGQTLAMFKPPGGISHVSLSPYDLQLVHASFRGDNFYVWDLYKVPQEVSLIGKFTRGKTSASIKEIVWFVNNRNGVEGTNTGFGCITKKLGSIHWYNVNYLSCGNENNNYPNNLDGGGNAVLQSGQFLDLWILPSMKAMTFCKLPSCANVPETFTAKQNHKDDEHFFKLNRIAFIDQKNCLRLFSPLNGKHTFKYALPAEPVADPPYVGLISECVSDPHQFAHLQPNSSTEAYTPLSQAEIETCMPYVSLINNKNVEFASYNFGSSADTTASAFYNHFEEFGSEIPVSTFDFRESGNTSPLLSSEEDLLHKFSGGLDISPDNYTEETVLVPQ